MNNPNTAVAVRPADKMKVFVSSDQFVHAIKAMLPPTLTMERFAGSVVYATMLNPKIAHCTPDSIINSCMKLAKCGLEADGVLAHLIPYGTECKNIIDYKGLNNMVYRTGMVSMCYADVVRDNDDFEYNMGEITKHKIDFRQPRGEIYAAYAVVKMKDGVILSVCMSKEEIETIRKASPGGNGDIWRKHYGEMCKKTVFRRLCKWVPLSPELRDVNRDEDLEEDVELPKTTDTGTTKRKTTQQPADIIEIKPEPIPMPEPEPEPLPEPPPDDDEIPFGTPEPTPKPAPKAESPLVSGIRGWISENKVDWAYVNELSNSQGWWAGTMTLESLTEESLTTLENNKRGILLSWKRTLAKKEGGAK